MEKRLQKQGSYLSVSDSHEIQTSKNDSNYIRQNSVRNIDVEDVEKSDDIDNLIGDPEDLETDEEEFDDHYLRLDDFEDFKK